MEMDQKLKLEIWFRMSGSGQISLKTEIVTKIKCIKQSISFQILEVDN